MEYTDEDAVNGGMVIYWVKGVCGGGCIIIWYVVVMRDWWEMREDESDERDVLKVEQ